MDRYTFYFMKIDNNNIYIERRILFLVYLGNLAGQLEIGVNKEENLLVFVTQDSIQLFIEFLSRTDHYHKFYFLITFKNRSI